METTSADLISIAHAARSLGIGRSTLWKQVQNGAIRNHGGLVILAEVIADRAANIDKTKARNRGKVAQAGAGTAKRKGRRNAVAASEATPKAAKAEVDPRSLTGALTRERNTIAELRSIELQVKQGKLVDRAGAERAMFEKSRTLRDAWLGWPSRVAEVMAARLPRIDGRGTVDPAALRAVLFQAVEDHLRDLSLGIVRDGVPAGQSATL